MPFSPVTAMDSGNRSAQISNKVCGIPANRMGEMVVFGSETAKDCIDMDRSSQVAVKWMILINSQSPDSSSGSAVHSQDGSQVNRLRVQTLQNSYEIKSERSARNARLICLEFPSRRIAGIIPAAE